MTFKYTRSKQLPATITHSLHAFLSIVLCFTGKMTFQHFQLQSQGATVCGCAGPEKPQKLGGLSCWVTSLLLPPILLQAAPRETPWMDHQAHSLQQTVCRLLLWTAENPPFPSDLIWILYCPCLSGHFPKRKKKDRPFQPRKQMLAAAFTGRHPPWASGFFSETPNDTL